jgi:hypothetical protein
VLYREGVYELFLTEKDLKLIGLMLSEDGIYRSSKPEMMELLDVLYERGRAVILDFLKALEQK